jgi:hypothetical protein
LRSHACLPPWAEIARSMICRARLSPTAQEAGPTAVWRTPAPHEAAHGSIMTAVMAKADVARHLTKAGPPGSPR